MACAGAVGRIIAAAHERDLSRRPRNRALRSCSLPSSSRYFAKATQWQHLRADALAGLTVAIVALPLSMAIAIASGASPAQGLVRGDRRRLHRLGARRQPLSDRRAGRRFHRARRGDGAGARPRRLAARDDDVGLDPCRDRLLEARHVHQVHPVSRDGRLHGRHRRDHSGEPAQGSARARARGARARRAAREAAGALPRICRRSTARRSRCRSRRSPSSSA